MIALELIRPAADGSVRLSPLVQGVTADSRAVRPGTVFVATARDPAARLRHIDDAVRRGALAVVTSSDTRLARALPIPLIYVASPRRLLAAMACELNGHPARALRAVAVTGTSGKTTTVEFIVATLRAAGLLVGAVGSLYPVDPDDPWPLTTPAADTLQAALRRMLEQGCRYAVLEVTSHAIDQERVAGIPFRAAVLTNLGRDHLDYHGSLEAYWRTKARLFAELSGDAFAVLPRGEAVERFVRPGLRVPVLTYDLSDADVAVLDVARDPLGARSLTLRTPRGPLTTSLGLPGPGPLRSALAAAAVGEGLGLPPAAIARGLAAVRRVPGRMERLDLAGRSFWIDYAHNPIGLEHCLAGVREVTAGRVLHVFGGRGHRDRGKLPLMGEISGRLADRTILTADSPEGEDPAELAAEIARGLGAVGKTAPYVESRLEAIRLAYEESAPGDAIVLTGRGPERFRRMGDVSVAATDAELIREAVGGATPPPPWHPSPLEDRPWTSP